MKTLTQGFSWKLSSQKPNESSQITGKSLTCGLVSIPWRKKKNNCMNIYQVELSHVLLEHVLLEQAIRRANTQRCRTGGNKCFSPSTKDSKTDDVFCSFRSKLKVWNHQKGAVAALLELGAAAFSVLLYKCRKYKLLKIPDSDKEYWFLTF